LLISWKRRHNQKTEKNETIAINHKQVKLLVPFVRSIVRSGREINGSGQLGGRNNTHLINFRFIIKHLIDRTFAAISNPQSID